MRDHPYGAMHTKIAKATSSRRASKTTSSSSTIITVNLPSITKGRIGWPDLTLFRSNSEIRAQEWTVLPNVTLSDYLYVVTKLTPRPLLMRPKRYITAMGGHGKFRKIFAKHTESLQMKLSRTNTPTEVDQFTENLIRTITRCFNRTYHKIRQKRLTHFYWWTPEMASQRNKITALSRRHKKQLFPTNHIAESFKSIIAKEKARLKKLKAKARSSTWKKYCGLQTATYDKVYKLAHGKSFAPSKILIQWPKHSNTLEAKRQQQEQQQRSREAIQTCPEIGA